MKKPAIILISIGIMYLFSQSAKAQSSEETNDTWYVWVDVTVPIDEKPTRLISSEPLTITCCPQSAKYRKFVKKTSKWLIANVAPEFNGELALSKIQDFSLAKEMIDKAKQSDNARIIDYQGSCN
jgi:hypothetical protein